METDCDWSVLAVNKELKLLYARFHRSSISSSQPMNFSAHPHVMIISVYCEYGFYLLCIMSLSPVCVG